MRWSGCLSRVLLLMLFLCMGAAPATEPATTATTQSTLESLSARVIDAIQQKKTGRFIREIDTELADALKAMDALDAERVISLVIYRRLAEITQQVSSDDTEHLWQRMIWVAQHPAMARSLMLAICDRDDVKHVVEVLDTLYAAEQDRLLQMPDLVAAICVVWDVPAPNRGVIPAPNDPQHAVRVFQYYRAVRGKLQMDIGTLPRELLVYVAAINVTTEEMRWAYQRYADNAAVGRTYFAVAYDTAWFMGTAEKRVSKAAYTLPNLLQKGGVCIDQAHFSSTVSRSVGVPAAIVTGDQADHGDRHAWLGYLQKQGGRIVWNFDTGRYPELRFWTGYIHDPQSDELLAESEVGITAELANTPAPRRDLAQALAIAAEWQPTETAVPLLGKAVNLSPGNRRAWMRLAHLGAQGKLSAAQSNQLTNALKVAIKQYPEFVLTVYMRLMEGYPPAERVAAIQKTAKLFDARRDLVARLVVAEGDILADSSPADALRLYGSVFTRYIDTGPIVLEALDRADTLLSRNRDYPRLQKLYLFAWERMPSPKPSPRASLTPYYMIGERLSNLARRNGDLDVARKIESRLSALNMERTSDK